MTASPQAFLLPDLRAARSAPHGNCTRLKPLVLRWTCRIAQLHLRLIRSAAGALFDPSAVRRILVVRLDRIGDVVMMSPFLRELRHGFPAAQITLLVTPEVRPVVATCPYVDDVLTFSAPSPRFFRKAMRFVETIMTGAGPLRRRTFDLALLPRWDAEPFAGPLLCLLSEARWRVAYSEGVSTDKARACTGYDACFTHTVDRRSPRHEVESNLDLLRCLGLSPVADHLELWPTEADSARVADLLAGQGLAKAPLAALAPGASEANKTWPRERYAEVGRWLQQRHGMRLVVIGGPSDRDLGVTLADELAAGAVSWAGHLTLRETFALLKRCALYIGNDSGPMHMAAAAGLPVVAISRSIREGDPCRDQSPERFRPWGVTHLMVHPAQPRPPCTDRCRAPQPHCILNVGTAQVVEAVESMVQQGIGAALRGSTAEASVPV